MRVFITLLRRELAAYFVSFTGYVVIAAAAFLMGLGLVSMVDALRDTPSGMPMTRLFFDTAYFWVILLPASPVITMRLFAHERVTGTFETLMTTPVSDLEVVLAKFTAAWLFFMLMWLPLLPGMFIVRHFIGEAGYLDAGTVAGMYIALALIGALFVSMGTFASSLTKSQALAAMTSLALGVGLFLVGLWCDRAPMDTDWEHQVSAQFAMSRHLFALVHGTVDTRHVVFYLSGTVLFSFLTLRVIESRRWK